MENNIFASDELLKSLYFQFVQEHRNRLKNDKRWDGNDMLNWAKTFLPSHFAKPPSKMHVWLAEKLDTFRSEKGIKLNVLAPRGAAKSTIGTLAYPLREALEGHEPYIWIISDTMSQAHSHLENIKAELTDNRQIEKYYPKVYGKGHLWRCGQIVLRNGCTIEAYGTGQRLRGRRKKQFRPSLIICDDLQNDNHIVSSNAREKSRNWFHGTLLKAGNSETNIINLATALHKEAVAIELTEKAGWNSRVFKAIEEWPKNMTLWEKWESIYTKIEDAEYTKKAFDYYKKNEAKMNDGVSVLWPEHESIYMLMKMRCESGRTAFEREKQNSPVNPEHCEFLESYFTENIYYDCIPTEFIASAIALDPSKGKNSNRGDYSAYVFACLDKNGTYFVDADLGRRPVSEIISTGIEFYKKHLPQIFGVEANQFQELLQQDFEREFKNHGIFSISPYPLINRTNKNVRIRRLETLLSSSRLKFNGNNPSVKLLIEQLKTFPIGDHDDGPDALEMAIRLIDMLISEDKTQIDGLGNRLNLYTK